MAVAHSKVSIQSRARNLITAFFLFCLALFLTSYSSREPTFGRLGVVIVGELLRPFSLATTWGISSISNLWDSYIKLLNVRERNELLEERLRALETRSSILSELEQENRKLRSLLGIVEGRTVDGIGAGVIGYDPSNWTRTVTIDKGSYHGIEDGMAVVDSDGVVGQVMTAGYRTSRVLLITDRINGVDSFVQSSRVRGVVVGSKAGSCQMLYVAKEDEVKIGDRVITSGMDSVYPKGLLVGVVSSVETPETGLFKNIEVIPSADLGRLEHVLVIKHGLPGR